MRMINKKNEPNCVKLDLNGWTNQKQTLAWAHPNATGQNVRYKMALALNCTTTEN